MKELADTQHLLYGPRLPPPKFLAYESQNVTKNKLDSLSNGKEEKMWNCKMRCHITP